jgi:hypothetical protein
MLVRCLYTLFLVLVLAVRSMVGALFKQLFLVLARAVRGVVGAHIHQTSVYVTSAPTMNGRMVSF